MTAPEGLLSGIRVVELGHIVAGPTCAMLLAELGADVIKVERPGVGDQSRLSRGNQGYFLSFNRRKRSVEINLKTDKGREAFEKLLATADVLVDNYGPNVLERMGYDAEGLKRIKPDIIHVGIKGFLSGPYDDRNLLDEPAQMMGGLAYMTGPRGMPLRAGASLVDLTGAMFGVIGVLGSLLRRERQGTGADIRVGLFETVVFLVMQHIAKAGIADEVPAPMPERSVGKDLGWGIYSVFTTKDDRQVFIGVTSDTHWESFCRVFGQDELGAREEFRSNAGRRAAYDMLTQRTREIVKQLTFQEVLAKLEEANLPHAPVATPADLFDNPHLKARHHLRKAYAPDGTSSELPGMPIEFDNLTLAPLGDPPKLGEHTEEVLTELGFADDEIREASAE